MADVERSPNIERVELLDTRIREAYDTPNPVMLIFNDDIKTDNRVTKWGVPLIEHEPFNLKIPPKTPLTLKGLGSETIYAPSLGNRLFLNGVIIFFIPDGENDTYGLKVPETVVHQIGQATLPGEYQPVRYDATDIATLVERTSRLGTGMLAQALLYPSTAPYTIGPVAYWPDYWIA